MSRHAGFRAIKLIVAVMVVPVVFAACAHTELPAQVIPASPVGTAKLALKIAVLADSSQTIHEPWGFYEKVNPALANSVRDALVPDFERVVVVDDRASASDADLLAIPILFYGKPPKLTLTFVDQKTGGTVADLSSVKPFETNAPGARAYIGTDLALMSPGLVVPPVILLEEPYLQKHDAERYNAGLGPALLAMTTDLADQASKNQAIKSMLTHQQTSLGK